MQAEGRRFDADWLHQVSDKCKAANAYRALATLHFAECRSLTIWNIVEVILTSILFVMIRRKISIVNSMGMLLS